jgi:hypothetical protein
MTAKQTWRQRLLLINGPQTTTREMSSLCGPISNNKHQESNGYWSSVTWGPEEIVRSLRWDSKMRPWVLRDFDPRVTALARPRSNCTESQMRQQNKAASSAGLRPKSDCSGKAQKQSYSNLQTRSLVREGATKLQTCNCLKEISRRKQILVNIPRLG